MPDEIANQDRPPIYIPSEGAALRQGEIISDLVQTNRAVGGRTNEIGLVHHPYAIVLSQDCDLDWDYSSRQGPTVEGKALADVFFCQAMLAEQVYHRPNINSSIWKVIKKNQNDRYQFLEKVPMACDVEGIGIGELAVDFKHCFSLPTADVYDQIERQKSIAEAVDAAARRRCHLSGPYDRHFRHRVSFYQNRVALPEQHESEKLQG